MAKSPRKHRSGAAEDGQPSDNEAAGRGGDEADDAPDHDAPGEPYDGELLVLEPADAQGGAELPSEESEDKITSEKTDVRRPEAGGEVDAARLLPRGLVEARTGKGMLEGIRKDHPSNENAGDEMESEAESLGESNAARWCWSSGRDVEVETPGQNRSTCRQPAEYDVSR